MSPILFAMLMTIAAPSFEVRTLDGQSSEGVPTQFTSEGLTLQTAQGPVTFDAEKLASVSLKQKKTSTKPPALSVELIDGSTISGRQYTSDAERARIILSDGQTIETPVRNVLTVRLDHDSDALGAEWERLIGGKHNADLLVTRKDEAIDYHQGVLHNVTEEMVQFDVDGELLPVKRAKIFGLAYHHRDEGDHPAPRCRITDAAGSVWPVQTLTLSDKLQWTTPSGVAVSMPLEQIVQIDFSCGKILYLSDMTAEDTHWTPFFGSGKPLAIMEQFYSPRRNASFGGEPLRLAGTEYGKGLAIRSRTELTYRLPKDFNHFLAIAGIDDSVRPNGNVRLNVQGDGNVLLEATLTGNDPPKPIELDVTGVRRLTILVDFGANAGVGDDLLLCNARVTK